jgi:hypothetical protein
MYEELASVKEIVDLPPREALENAQAFLARQGYRVVQRTEESLTVSRREHETTSERPSLNLTVIAQPQPQGGVQIRVRGNDREGVQTRQAEWKRWADSLPKKGGPDEPGGAPALERQTEGQTSERRAKEGPSTTAEKGLGRKPARRPSGAPRSTQATPPRAELAAEPTVYEYRMVQIPPTISVQASQHKGDEAAQYMESIANSHSEQGWEFYRVDTLSVAIPPGCLAALFGDKGSQSQYYVVTFRRPK